MSCHKAQEVLDFLADIRHAITSAITRPHPLENLWSGFKDRFHERYIELSDAPSKCMDARHRYPELLKEVCYERGQELMDKLIASMPPRCQLVIEAKELWMKY